MTDSQTLIDALERVKHELMIPAAEYVPAIPDCWKIIDDAVNEYNRATYSPIPAAPSDVAGFDHLACAVQKMNAHSAVGWGDTNITRKEADAIMSRLQALSHDREVMREALEPFALAADNMDGDEPDTLFIYDSPESAMIYYADLRRARSALASLKGGA